MIEAYVLGRPMPSASSVRISVASVNRAGGCVSCEMASSSRQASSSPVAQGRQGRFLVVERRFGIVDPFDVRPEEPGKFDVPARGAELGVPGGDRRRLKAQPRLGHLRGDGPLPDQRIERQLAAREAQLFAGLHLGAGRADRFVGFLGPLRSSFRSVRTPSDRYSSP